MMYHRSSLSGWVQNRIYIRAVTMVLFFLSSAIMPGITKRYHLPGKGLCNG